MKKASATIEVALILCLVACVSFALLKVFNDQKMKLTELSKVKCRNASMCKE